jgi:uncharacterized protein (DUF433 family)
MSPNGALVLRRSQLKSVRPLARSDAMAESPLPIGTGIYGRADAARLLRVNASTLRRWVGGYTFRYKTRATETVERRKPPVVVSDLPTIDRKVALSFVELMELRVVKALVDREFSLQAIRVMAEIAAEHFRTTHPFASRRVYTDGQKVFAEVTRHLDRHPDVVELTRGKIAQVIAGGLFEPFLREIDFDEKTALADRWWPLGRDYPIVLDPEIAFGAPTIAGTSVRTSTVARMAEHSSPEAAADAYDLQIGPVVAAVRF